MTQNRKWFPNPQAAAEVSKRKNYTGHPELGSQVDGDTWLTPRYILSELGDFDLDPCAAETNRHWVAKRSFTKDDNGLMRPWTGRVFMNPPFSDTARWLRKHAEHELGISLVPASVESEVWRQFVWKRAAAVLLLFGRTRFNNPDGSSTTGRPLRSIALIAWSPADADILRNCRLAGCFLELWDLR